MNERFSSRWKRRAVTIPTMLAATALGMLALPLLVVVAAVFDIARLRRRLPTVRVLIFLIQYGLNDSAEILLAPIYWIAAGFGTTLASPSSVDRHQRLQAWSLALLARRAEQLLGLRIQVDDAGWEALAGDPPIVLCRHVSIVDSSLPALLYQRLGFRSCGVIMAELLADPGFDLLYQRSGSVFVSRDNGPEAQETIAGLGRDARADTATIIFPEGQLFRPERLARSLARIAERDPSRAQNLQGLRNVLPPRPGGFLALLETLPPRDVVVIAHAGLEALPTFAQLATSVPLRMPIHVTAWRVASSDIPSDREGCAVWLDAQWLRLDDWCDASQGALQDRLMDSLRRNDSERDDNST